MKYRAMGSHGPLVSAIGFGCWPMGAEDYGPIDDREMTLAVDRAIDVGVTRHPRTDMAALRQSSVKCLDRGGKTSSWSRSAVCIGTGKQTRGRSGGIVHGLPFLMDPGVSTSNCVAFGPITLTCGWSTGRM